MILVRDAGVARRVGVRRDSTAPVLPSTTIQEVGGEWVSTWAECVMPPGNDVVRWQDCC